MRIDNSEHSFNIRNSKERGHEPKINLLQKVQALLSEPMPMCSLPQKLKLLLLLRDVLGPDHRRIAVFGNAVFAPSTPGQPPAPVTKIRNYLARKGPSGPRGRVPHQQNLPPLPQPHRAEHQDARIQTLQNVCHWTWNRDVNGARNTGTLFRAHMAGLPRPAVGRVAEVGPGLLGRLLFLGRGGWRRGFVVVVMVVVLEDRTRTTTRKHTSRTRTRPQPRWRRLLGPAPRNATLLQPTRKKKVV